MDYQTLDTMRRTHPAWRLLLADYAPLVISFLQQAFIGTNTRSISEHELLSRLDDYLYQLRDQYDADLFPRTAAQYLTDWSSDTRAWLRKYYPANSDEAHYDITSATEKAIEWVTSLRKRVFVGTESRLLTVFELLRQIVDGSTADATVRLAELHRRKAALDAEIQKIEGGRLDFMDATQVKDRFMQAAATARALLSDFREVEQNFRELDRTVRERVATWEGTKGELLHDIFGARDAIGESDQGKSFRAFWDFLMSPQRQEELSALLETAFDLDPVRELEPDGRLRHIHYDWLEAGEAAQRTVARLSEQLRRYLDDQALIENRRIAQLIRQVEQHALAVRTHPPGGPCMQLDEAGPNIMLPLERPLFTPPMKTDMSGQVVVEGEESVPANALFEQVYVERERLANNVRRALQVRGQVSLAEVIELHPMEHGLAELIEYLNMAAENRSTAIEENSTQTIYWTDRAGTARRARVPLVIFCRNNASDQTSRSVQP
jgi:hypothetical protein